MPKIVIFLCTTYKFIHSSSLLNMNIDQVHGIFITREDGCHLVQFIQNPALKPELLSSFISGLFLFGKESVGHIDQIEIKGIDLEILVVYKNGLILSALFTKDMQKLNIRQEAEDMLDLFHEKYHEMLKDWKGCIDDFDDFSVILKNQITQYFSRLETKTIPNTF